MVDQLVGTFSENKSYIISNGRLQKPKIGHDNVHPSLELWFDQNTDVTEIEEGIKLPPVTYNFQNLEDITEERKELIGKNTVTNKSIHFILLVTNKNRKIQIY